MVLRYRAQFVLQIKSRAVDVRQVGRDLGVHYVVEGSVRKAGNKLRISGQLVDTASGNHIWADRFDGTVEDVFDLQDKITSNVAGAIEPRVQQAEIRRAQAKATDSLSAYDLLLRALACVQKGKDEGIDEALRLIEQAIVADRQFSSAYGLKAICHVQWKAMGCPRGGRLGLRGSVLSLAHCSSLDCIDRRYCRCPCIRSKCS
jgi:hypothetical protein